MSTARISVLGLMRYDNTLFDEMVLPSPPFNKGITSTEAPDKELLIAHILRRTANLEVFYPEMYGFKKMVGVWSRANLYKFTKLWETMLYEYNPIWNKQADYEEIEHYERDLKDTFAETTSGTRTNSGKEDINVNTSGTVNTNGSATTTEKISSYNTNELQNREQTSNTYNEGKTYSEGRTTGETHSDNDTLNSTTDNTNDATGTYDRTITRKEQGNIGVTTTQEMIQQERDISLFNWYDIVCDSFVAEFCINVY